MNDLQFKLLRLLVLLMTPVMLLNWLFMDSNLSPAKAHETEATISYTTKKEQEFVRLLTTELGEIELRCLRVRQLCDRSRPRSGTRLRVRLQDTSLLGGWWLVSAEQEGKPLVTLDIQSSDYTESKVMWGLGALAVAAMGFVFSYFAPFGAPMHEA